MNKHEITELKKFLKDTPFVFIGGADKDNYAESIGLTFRLQIESDVYKEIYIGHTHIGYRAIHFSYRNSHIHTGMKAMDRVSLLQKEGYFYVPISANDLIEVLPKTEEEFDRIISEYKTRMLGEVRYDEFYTFVNQVTL